ncbi:hypothetical protein [Longispora albida]|uniref:hypothetical protein n=1 Tax=Longispora albida TaxID=203523 RepID=UPI000366FAE8|nr:hypothetical protein [Longispora albida]
MTHQLHFPLPDAIAVLVAATATPGALMTAGEAAGWPSGHRLALHAVDGIRLLPALCPAYDDATPSVTAAGHGPGHDHHRAAHGPALAVGTTPIPMPHTLLADATAALADGARWLVLDVGDGASAFGFTTQATVLRPVLVHLEELPELLYPALVDAAGEPGELCDPAFPLTVVRQIAADLDRILTPFDHPATATVRVTRDGDVEVLQPRIGAGGQPMAAATVTRLAPDPDGLVRLGTFHDWTVDAGTRPPVTSCDCPDLTTPEPPGPAGACECDCPMTCVWCGQPIGEDHDPQCRWPAGSALYEQPAIRAETLVADRHCHRGGCPRGTRRPGALFSCWPDGETGEPEWDCDNCGTTGTRDLHTLIRANGLVEHHLRCTDCDQVVVLSSPA